MKPPEVLENAFDYMVRELEPLKKDLFKFWDELAEVRVSFREALFRKQISRLAEEHRNHLRRWRSAREKTVRLEAFISKDDPLATVKIGQLMSQPAIWESVKETEANVSSVMRDTTEILRGLNMEADFKRTGIFSLTAIMVASAAVVATVLFGVL